MSTFGSQNITEEGRALLSGALSGSIITFTRMVLSDGNGNSLSTDIDRLVKNADGVQVEATARSADNKNGFWAKTLSLYAKGDGAEVLFSTATDTNPDYMPTGKEADIAAGFIVSVGISNTDSITFETPAGKFVTVEMLADALGGQLFSFATDEAGNITIDLKS